ncbi:MAG: hypothetical protein AAFV27_07450 [Pseudomonadota bacterium]
MFSTVICWAVAALGGALACALLYNYADVGITGAIFLAGLLFLLVGLVLQWGIATPMPPVGEAKIEPPERKPSARMGEPISVPP